jgi:uracil-DNA glycosylase family 4
MSTEEQLRRVVRQIRTELEWAARTGIVVESPKVPEAPARTEGAPSQPPTPASLNPPARPPQVPPTPEPPTSAVVPQANLQSAPAVAPQANLQSAPAVAPQATLQSAPAVVPQANLQPGPTPPAPARLPVLAEQLAACTTLEGVREVLGDCTRCKLAKQGRQQIVYGVGAANAEIMFIGEGPGAEEDRRGEPFVGAAGELLTSIIENGMGIRRGEVYIANVVKCRPPQNRDPEPDEVAACEPFLAAQIRAIKPKVLITLGKHAAHTLLGVQTPITRMRGKWGEYQGTPLMPTFHPAYLLRNPAEKRAVWEDVKEVLRFLGRPLPGRGAK